MPTRNVVLTEHQNELISALIASGRYQNASEVLRDGLRLLERDQRMFDARIDVFREAVQIGWDDIDAGRYTDVADEDLAEFVTDLSPRLRRAANPDPT